MTESVDDEDEVLIALSASLGKLVPHIGGPAFAHTLLTPLELLLTVGTLYMLYLIYIYITSCILSCHVTNDTSMFRFFIVYYNYFLIREQNFLL